MCSLSEASKVSPGAMDQTTQEVGRFGSKHQFCLFYTCILANSSYTVWHADSRITQHSLEALEMKSYQKAFSATKHVGVAKSQSLTICHKTGWNNSHTQGQSRMTLSVCHNRPALIVVIWSIGDITLTPTLLSWQSTILLPMLSFLHSDSEISNCLVAEQGYATSVSEHWLVDEPCGRGRAASRDIGLFTVLLALTRTRMIRLASNRIWMMFVNLWRAS